MVQRESALERETNPSPSLFSSPPSFSIEHQFVVLCLERYHELDKRSREVESANQELRQLNGQLEKDLLSVGGVSALFRRGPEVK